MSPSPPLSSIGDPLVATFRAMIVVVSEVVTSHPDGISVGPMTQELRNDDAYHRAKDSVQKTHEYGFSPESDKGILG